MQIIFKTSLSILAATLIGCGGGSGDIGDIGGSGNIEDTDVSTSELNTDTDSEATTVDLILESEIGDTEDTPIGIPATDGTLTGYDARILGFVFGESLDQLIARDSARINISVTEDGGSFSMQNGRVIPTDGTCLQFDVDLSEAEWDRFNPATLFTPVDVETRNVTTGTAEGITSRTIQYVSFGEDEMSTAEAGSTFIFSSDSVCFFGDLSEGIIIDDFRGGELELSLDGGDFVEFSYRVEIPDITIFE